MTRARTVAGGTGSLADYLDKRHIHPRAQAATRDELLESLAGGLHAAGALGDVRAFVRAVRLRMTQGANGFHGIALLAAQNRAVNGPAAAFARIPPELGWRGADDRPVRDVFLLAAPRKLRDTDCARAYSVLARHTAHPGFRRMLAAARTTDDLYDLFRLIR
ncbi:PTS sugar transporter subunit IIA [Streptomyces chrestomyceticus]|uniref:PTS sugar transporter subunit IIA n=1 Tax=Streptomyces chrestomyceticus TaxID=68185 RepID=UPI0019D003E5|nr:PTS sugar transporter subunit IIA [Streptomyces chrestomyceticus]